MRRLGLMLCLGMAMWLSQGCEAQQAGSMELVFTWPDGAPDFEDKDLYLRGELQVWPDGVDEAGNPLTVSQRFTGRSSADALTEWIKLGGPESLSFDGLSYGVDLGVVLEVHGPNGQGTADPPGDLLYYGRSQLFQLSAGTDTTVEVPLGIQAAPGVSARPDASPGDRSLEGTIRLCQADLEAGPTAPEECNDAVVASSAVTLYFEAPNATRALIANDAAFSLGLQEVELKDLTAVEGTLYRYPTPWDLNAGLPEGTGDGLRSVYVSLENALGLKGKAQSHAVTLDTTGPSVSVVLSPEQDAYAPGASVELLISANEALSGQPSVRLDGEALSIEATESGAYPLTLPNPKSDASVSLELTVSDAANNTTSWTRALSIDATPPALVIGSQTLSGGTDTACAFAQDFQGSTCSPGEMGSSVAPGDALTVTFEFVEAAPERHSTTGELTPPTLKVGPYSANETCTVSETGETLTASCTFTAPDNESTVNQVFEISTTLKDAAQNEVTVLLGSVDYVPSPPTAFALGQPVPTYNGPGCVVSLSVGVLGGVPATVTLSESEGSGLICERTEGASVTPESHPFTCSCSGEVSLGTHTFIASGTDYFGRTWQSPLDASVIYDPQPPEIVAESIALSGGIDEGCLFAAEYLESGCAPGDMGWSLAPGDTLSVSFEVDEAHPLIDPATGAAQAPALKVGPFVDPTACATTETESTTQVSCAFTMPEPAEGEMSNQELEVSVTLRDQALNEVSSPLGALRFVPKAPTAFALGQPVPTFNGPGCVVSLSVGVLGGVPATVTLSESEGSGLICERTKGASVTPESHPFTCTCSGEVSSGTHTFIASGTDYFGRTWQSPLDANVIYDPDPPIVVEESVTLTGGINEECLFFALFSEEVCPDADAPLSYAPGQTLYVDFRVTEDNPALAPASAEVLAPALRVGPFLALSACEVAPDDAGMDVSCSYVLPEGGANQELEVSVTLRDQAANETSTALGIIRHVPDLPTASALGQPVPFYNQAGCLVSVSVAISGGIPKTVELFSPHSDTLLCARAEGVAPTVDTHPFTCACQDPTLRGGHQLTVQGTDFFDRPFDADHVTTVFVDPNPPEVIRPPALTINDGESLVPAFFCPYACDASFAGCVDACGDDEGCVASCSELMEACELGTLEEPEPVLLTEGDTVTVQLALAAETIDAKEQFSPKSVGYLLDSESSQLSLGTIPLTLIESEPAPDDPDVVLTTWEVLIQAGFHGSAEGPSQALSGFLRDPVGNETPLSDSQKVLDCPQSRVTLDFTPPDVTLTAPFWQVMTYGELPQLPFIASPDTVEVSYAAWPCVEDCDQVSDAIPLDTESVNGEGAKSQWTFEPDPQGILAEGLYRISAALTDAAGLTSTECEGPEGVDACWLGVLEIDLHPPTIEVTHFEAPLLGGPAPPEEGIVLHATLTDTMATQHGDNRLHYAVRLANQTFEDSASEEGVSSCTATWSDDGHQAGIACVIQPNAATPSGVYELQIEASDAAHKGVNAATLIAGTVVFDNTPPSIVQTVLIPEAQALVKPLDSVQLNLTFTEPVTISAETLTAYHEDEAPDDPESNTFTLERVSEPTSNVHVWQGVVPMSQWTTTDGPHYLDLAALTIVDDAGNPSDAPKALQAFTLDATPLPLQRAVMTLLPSKDAGPAEEGFAGIGATIKVEFLFDGDAQDLVIEQSEVSFGGYPLRHDEKSAHTWTATVTADKDDLFNGYRELEGYLIDAAGNRSMLNQLHGDDRPSVTIDSLPPLVSLAAFVPLDGEVAPAGQPLYASLSFNEPVLITSNMLSAEAKPTGEGQDQPTPILLERDLNDPTLATGHQWSGVAEESQAYQLDQSYTIQPLAYDRAGNPWQGDPIVAFSVDTAPPVIDQVSVLIEAEDDDHPPQPSFAGDGDTVVVALAVQGLAGKNWEPSLSSVDLDGIPLTWNESAERWELLVNTEDHQSALGERTLRGEIVDAAGNVALLDEASLPEVSPWPKLVIDASPPQLAISAQFQRCDGYTPAQKAEDYLYVPETWDVEKECNESFFVGSCIDPELVEPTIDDPVRMSFLFDEPIRVELASVWLVSETENAEGAPLATLKATIDPCSSTADDISTRLVAWVDPTDLKDIPFVTHFNALIEVSDGAGTMATITTGTLELIREAPDAALVDTPGMVTFHRAPWGTSDAEPNSSWVSGDKEAVERDRQVLVYDSPDLETAQLLNQGASLGTSSGESGAFEIPLTAGDRAEVYILVRDKAGNRSPMRRIRDISWTATLGGKVADSQVENPHQLITTPVWSDSLEQPYGVEAGEPSGGLATQGAPSWRERAIRVEQPSNRSGHAMAYDAARGVTTLFGGGDFLGDLWTWDGETWTEEAPPDPRPSGRRAHAMTYDAARGVTVLFGGLRSGGAAGYTQDTWEWDGETWTERIPQGPVPPKRFQHAMAYDAARGVSVLFGGEGPDTDGQDTWEWDGESWREVSKSGMTPSPRRNHRMSYDDLREVTVLFGGAAVNGSAATNDTWEWDGESWTLRDLLVDGPSARSEHTMVYDTTRRKTLLFGGSPCFSCVDETMSDLWEYDGTKWTERTSPDALVPRQAHGAMVYDIASQKAVSFGGVVEDDEGWVTYWDSVWLWDGSTWSEKSTTSTTPPAYGSPSLVYDAQEGKAVLIGRHYKDGVQTWHWDGEHWTAAAEGLHPDAGSGNATAYDSKRFVTVLFGGSDVSDADLDTNELWEWDGANWEEKPQGATLPFARSSHRMVYDTARDRTLLFGGADPSGFHFEDTWEWDGENWTEHTGLSPMPPGRNIFAMTYDSERSVAVLFGGHVGGGNFTQDTWEWDGASWNEPTLLGPPPPARAYHAMSYDTARHVTTLFGGYVDGFQAADLWEWNGVSWTERTPTGALPDARLNHAMTYDSARGVTLVFGGSSVGGQGLQDTWELHANEDRRAGHRFSVSWPEAMADEASELTGITARWLGEATGYGLEDDCAANDEGQIRTWTGLEWVKLGDTEVETSASGPSTFTWSTTDPEMLERLLFQKEGEESIHVAFIPKAPNGCGPDYGEVRTDDVALTVDYRLPAESE